MLLTASNRRIVGLRRNMQVAIKSGQSSRADIESYSPYIRILLFMIAAAPFAIAYSRSIPAWDELFFLTHATCVNQAVYSGSPQALDACLLRISKSPIMTLLLIPAGPIKGDLRIIGLASVVLALAILGLAICLGKAASRLRVPVWATCLACISVLLVPSIRNAGAPLLADGILSLAVAGTLLLPFLETQRDVPSAPLSDGALWGALFTLGACAKLTYFMFAGPAFLIAAILSYRRLGPRLTAIKIGMAALVAAPALILLGRYGSQFLQHAQNFSFGSLASFYDDGVARWSFLRQQPFEAPVTMALWAVLAGVAAWRWRYDPRRVATGFVAVGIIILFDVLAAGSPNKDPRFFWPVWVSLPICLAVAIPPYSINSSSLRLSPAVRLAFATAVLLALPMYWRMDLRAVENAQVALETAQQRGAKSVAIAADTAAINIDAFVLASRINPTQFGDMSISTVVYDIMYGKDASASLAHLMSADVVAFFQPDGSAPEWANRNYSTFSTALVSDQREVVSPSGAGPIQLSFPKR